MTRARIELDFAGRRRINRRGVILLAAGVVAAALVLADYRVDAARRDGLDLRLADLQAPRTARKPDKAAQRIAEENRAALAELTIPWSRLLQELEVASADSKGSVAVLGVEPDRDKRQVRVLAEARTLPIALAYVERLQKSEALHYPMLESHEVQLRDPQRPVRFQITADWSAAP
ncbi:MAG TPA: hypothetical protein VH814_26300 [Steroidobacteraceae bacterium]|jgi:hypothetical protein